MYPCWLRANRKWESKLGGRLGEAVVHWIRFCFFLTQVTQHMNNNNVITTILASTSIHHSFGNNSQIQTNKHAQRQDVTAETNSSEWIRLPRVRGNRSCTNTTVATAEELLRPDKSWGEVPSETSPDTHTHTRTRYNMLGNTGKLEDGRGVW